MLALCHSWKSTGIYESHTRALWRNKWRMAGFKFSHKLKVQTIFVKMFAKLHYPQRSHVRFWANMDWFYGVMLIMQNCSLRARIFLFLNLKCSIQSVFVCLCLPFSVESVYSSEKFSRAKTPMWWLGKPLLKDDLHFIRKRFGRRRNMRMWGHWVVILFLLWVSVILFPCLYASFKRTFSFINYRRRW